MTRLLVVALWILVATPVCHAFGIPATILDPTGDSVSMPAGTSSVAFSPGGDHGYVAGTPGVAFPGTLTVYERNPLTGDLTFVEQEEDGTNGVVLPRVGEVVVSPDGKHVYMAGGGVSVFTRDASTGEVTYVENHGPTTRTSSVVISADGAHVYVGGGALSAITTYSRDLTTGALILVDVEAEAQTIVRLSPDGAHLYASRTVFPWTSDVVVFERDLVTGELSLVDTIVKLGESAGDFGREILFSPDARFVYLLGALGTDGAIAVLERDLVSGLLSLAEFQTDGKGGVDGLDGPAHFGMSADGSQVYAVSRPIEDALTVFSRNPDTGALAFVTSDYDTLAGLNPDGIFVAPDGQHVYALGEGLFDRLTVFAPGYSGCTPAPLPGCKNAGRGVVVIKDRAKDSKDKLKWTWKDGQATTLGEFDPGPSDHRAVCGYDGVGQTLFLHALVPAGGDCKPGKPCWQVKPTAVKYKDPFSTPEGIRKIILKPSDVDATRGVISGGRDPLELAGLPLTLPVLLQLQSESGACWETTFPAATINDGETFKTVLK